MLWEMGRICCCAGRRAAGESERERRDEMREVADGLALKALERSAAVIVVEFLSSRSVFGCCRGKIRAWVFSDAESCARAVSCVLTFLSFLRFRRYEAVSSNRRLRHTKQVFSTRKRISINGKVIPLIKGKRYPNHQQTLEDSIILLGR
jgi:hypothetical protein